jgi:hypothetical protein
LSFFVYDASAMIAKRIAKKPFSGLDRGQSLVFQEFMQMWVGYKLVKVLRIFGLQPTGIREGLQSWSPDLAILFMFFKDKTQRILDLLFDKTDHDGNFSAIKFGAKSNIEKIKDNTLFLVMLTWLQQLQQYFYNCPERDKNCN